MVVLPDTKRESWRPVLTDGQLKDSVLSKPLRWAGRRTVYVRDLFHPDIPFKHIAAVYGVMAVCPLHTFLVTTKHAARRIQFFKWLDKPSKGTPRDIIQKFAYAPLLFGGRRVTTDNQALEGARACQHSNERQCWPASNIWEGVSVQDQRTADERIPLLLQTAAMCFVLYEPALEWVEFRLFMQHSICNGCGQLQPCESDCPCGSAVYTGNTLDWVLVSGEDGAKARPFDLAVARSTIEQCRTAGVRCYIKQLGSDPHECADDCSYCCDPHYGHPPPHMLVVLDDKKGADPTEWPQGLNVREIPTHK